MRTVNYPVTTSILTEARMYASDSIQHTMDYEGWGDQHEKWNRIVYGNFGQLWVAEFCRLNGIDHQKDASSPTRPDDHDIIIRGARVDVKTSIMPGLVGQVSPGVINKPCEYFCFLLTDRTCTYIAPYGFIEVDRYREIAVEVQRGEIIPGTRIEQRFSRSFFLPAEYELIPFVQFMLSGDRARSRVIQPSSIVDGRAIEALSQNVANVESVLLQMLKTAKVTKRQKKGSGEVAYLRPVDDLFGKDGTT